MLSELPGDTRSRSAVPAGLPVAICQSAALAEDPDAADFEKKKRAAWEFGFGLSRRFKESPTPLEVQSEIFATACKNGDRPDFSEWNDFFEKAKKDRPEWMAPVIHATHGLSPLSQSIVLGTLAEERVGGRLEAYDRDMEGGAVKITKDIKEKIEKNIEAGNPAPYPAGTELGSAAGLACLVSSNPQSASLEAVKATMNLSRMNGSEFELFFKNLSLIALPLSNGEDDRMAKEQRERDRISTFRNANHLIDSVLINENDEEKRKTGRLYLAQSFMTAVVDQMRSKPDKAEMLSALELPSERAMHDAMLAEECHALQLYGAIAAHGKREPDELRKLLSGKSETGVSTLHSTLKERRRDSIWSYCNTVRSVAEKLSPSDRIELMAYMQSAKIKPGRHNFLSNFFGMSKLKEYRNMSKAQKDLYNEIMKELKK